MSSDRTSPLAALLIDSVDPSELGAPVDRSLLALAAGGSGALLAAAWFGRFWADPESGDWMFFDGVVSAALGLVQLIATPVGVVALTMLALDAMLASGVAVGAWARTVCVVQFIGAGVALLPVLAVVICAALTVLAYVALFVIVLFLVGLLLGGG